MKKVILAATALIFSVGAFAQSQDLGFGVKAGVNFPKYSFGSGDNSAETKAATNFFVTAYLDAPIFTDYLYIQPGVSYQGKGAKFIDTEEGEYKQNTSWIEVPINVVFKVPTGTAGHFFVGAGPYIGFGISGKNKLSDKNGNSSEIGDFKFGKDKSLKSTDFGFNFLAGYQLTSGLIINGGYGLGITDLAPESRGVKQTNRVWSIGLGFGI
ncbi:Outer membrane protein beta-barrel domain-containing protein [bacterium A37T11]|nr:Outer membrane protein beta-barrel domain-containing protein [bacterium A37T11]